MSTLIIHRPDGSVIREKNDVTTFVTFLSEVGPERICTSGLGDFITKEKKDRCSVIPGTEYFAYTKTDSPKKCKQVNDIAEGLGLAYHAEINQPDQKEEGEIMEGKRVIVIEKDSSVCKFLFEGESARQTLAAFIDYLSPKEVASYGIQKSGHNIVMKEQEPIDTDQWILVSDGYMVFVKMGAEDIAKTINEISEIMQLSAVAKVIPRSAVVLSPYMLSKLFDEYDDCFEDALPISFTCKKYQEEPEKCQKKWEDWDKKHQFYVVDDFSNGDFDSEHGAESRTVVFSFEGALYAVDYWYGQYFDSHCFVGVEPRRVYRKERVETIVYYDDKP